MDWLEREFITLGGAPQQSKAARELSRAAFGMNCRRGPVPFITCGKNNELRTKSIAHRLRGDCRSSRSFALTRRFDVLFHNCKPNFAVQPV
jgi:hypothetical protein